MTTVDEDDNDEEEEGVKAGFVGTLGESIRSAPPPLPLPLTATDILGSGEQKKQQQRLTKRLKPQQSVAPSTSQHQNTAIRPRGQRAPIVPSMTRSLYLMKANRKKCSISTSHLWKHSGGWILQHRLCLSQLQWIIQTVLWRLYTKIGVGLDNTFINGFYFGFKSCLDLIVNIDYDVMTANNAPKGLSYLVRLVGQRNQTKWRSAYYCWMTLDYSVIQMRQKVILYNF